MNFKNKFARVRAEYATWGLPYIPQKDFEIEGLCKIIRMNPPNRHHKNGMIHRDSLHQTIQDVHPYQS